jgi:hypothetical protein
MRYPCRCATLAVSVRREVSIVSAPTATRPPKSEAAPVESAVLSVDRHVERVRKFRRSLVIYALALVVLTPTWVVTQYYIQDGWPKHLSTRSRYAGDWDPWIIWVALVGAFVVAIYGYRAYFDRGKTEND